MSLNLIPQLGDILWVVTGFALGFIALALLTAAWWAEARRNDRQNNELAVLQAQVRRLRALVGDKQHENTNGRHRATDRGSVPGTR